MPLQKKIKYFIVLFSFVLCVLLILNRRGINFFQFTNTSFLKTTLYTYNFNLKRKYTLTDPIENIVKFIFNETNKINIFDIDFSQNLKESDFFFDMLIFIYPKKYNPSSKYMICLDYNGIYLSGEKCEIYE